MNRYLTCLVAAIIVLLTISISPSPGVAADDSYFILRLNGTVQPLPGMLSGDVYLMSQNERVEFLGFRIVNSQSGKKITVRPGHSGYYGKKLGPGTWTLERDRRDRPDKGDKIIKILTFEVPEGSLVNLGTINIVLDGKPTERIMDRPDRFTGGVRTTGTYTYSFHYERPGGADDFTWPVNTLKERSSKVYDQYQGNLVEMKEAVTSDKEGSKIKLESVGD